MANSELGNCALCGHLIAASAEKCVGCGAPGDVARQAANVDDKTAYSKIPKCKLILGAIGAPFLAATLAAGATILMIWIPVVGWLLIAGAWIAVFASPFVYYFVMRDAIAGPCPYCHAKAGPSPRPFTCRNCRKRVLVQDGAFARVPAC